TRPQRSHGRPLHGLLFLKHNIRLRLFGKTFRRRRTRRFCRKRRRSPVLANDMQEITLIRPSSTISRGDFQMAAQMEVGGAAKITPDKSDGTNEVMANLAYRRLAIVNVVFLGSKEPDAGGWVLIDAGVLGSKNLIKEAAEHRFGACARPNAIL